MLKRVMRVFAAALLSVGIVSAPAFADTTPSLGKTTVTVSGINSGDTISAYAIATVHVAAGKDASGADAAAGEVFDPVAEVPELPTTGGVGTIVFSVLGVVIMAVAIVLFIRRKQQK